MIVTDQLSRESSHNFCKVIFYWFFSSNFWKCSKCGESFPSHSNLLDHYRNFHTEVNLSPVVRAETVLAGVKIEIAETEEAETQA